MGWMPALSPWLHPLPNLRAGEPFTNPGVPNATGLIRQKIKLGQILHHLRAYWGPPEDRGSF
jgi:hypothetical protein